MKPTKNLAQTFSKNGTRFSLHEHDGEYSLRVDGTQLMTSRLTLSEIRLAEVACRELANVECPRVLIGGLGLGYSLKRVLELVGKNSEVVVAELLPEIVAWNREFLFDLNGALLDDVRVKVFEGDVYDCIHQAGRNRFDAMLLDVDNGPASPVLYENARLYERNSLTAIHSSLKPGGHVVFWSAGQEKNFPSELKKIGFSVEEEAVKVHERARRAVHWVYLGVRR